MYTIIPIFFALLLCDLSNSLLHGLICLAGGEEPIENRTPRMQTAREKFLFLTQWLERFNSAYTSTAISSAVVLGIPKITTYRFSLV